MQFTTYSELHQCQCENSLITIELICNVSILASQKTSNSILSQNNAQCAKFRIKNCEKRIAQTYTAMSFTIARSGSREVSQRFLEAKIGRKGG